MTEEEIDEEIRHFDESYEDDFSSSKEAIQTKQLLDEKLEDAIEDEVDGLWEEM
jgi:hypothetical protein